MTRLSLQAPVWTVHGWPGLLTVTSPRGPCITRHCECGDKSELFQHWLITRGFIKQHKKYVNICVSLQWSHQNIVTRHQGTMRQLYNQDSVTRWEMRSHWRQVLHFVGSQSNKHSPEGERTAFYFLQSSASSESASNNPSLVFVINSKSLIYIFQLLDVWICSEERREAWVQAADSGGRGQRGEDPRNRLKFPQLTTQTQTTNTTSRASVTTTVNLFLKTPFSVFSPSAWWVMGDVRSWVPSHQ